MCVLHASMHACAHAWTYIPHMPPIPFALFLSPPPSLLIQFSNTKSSYCEFPSQGQNLPEP